MSIEQKKTVKVDELAQVISFKGGATFSQLWQIFFYTRLFKYMHKSHYVRIKKAYNKICRKRIFTSLCDLGYLKSPQPNIYCATDKVLPILKEAGFPISILPPETRGSGDINELHNSEVFVSLTKLPYFHTILYPPFKHVIPDALLVELDAQNRRYKLTFIEVEAYKPKWSDYLEDKRNKYLHLASITDFYSYWKETAPKLELPVPPLDKFSFSVTFVCSIKKDFGKGFNFITSY